MKWRGKLNLKTEEESWLTVLYCRWPNKVSCKNHSNTPGISMHTSLKEAKRKQKWTTFARIHRLACQRNTLPCAPEHFEASCFSRSVLIRTPVDFKRFCLEKGSVPSIYAKSKDPLDTDYPRNDGRLANRFFPKKRSLEVFWGPTEKRQYPKFPSPKKSISFRIG